MVDKYHDAAVANKTKIVNCCGYDSVPSDMGTLVVSELFQKVIGKPPTSVKAIYGRVKYEAASHVEERGP